MGKNIFFTFGVGAGATYATSRSYLAFLIGKEEIGSYFGLYTFAEKFASIIGPLIWGIIILALAKFAPLNYRAAATAMGILVLIGATFLVKLKPKVN